MNNPDINPNISLIVAMTPEGAIGKDNSLIWHISEDLKRFKALTSGHTVIMGRNTWNSLPRRPLPKRRNLVITHDSTFCDEGAEVVHSVEEALTAVAHDEEPFVIGGASVYRQFLPYANKIYVTWVWQNFDADVFFPKIDPTIFAVISESERFTDHDSKLTYSFSEYSRL